MDLAEGGDREADPDGSGFLPLMTETGFYSRRRQVLGHSGWLEVRWCGEAPGGDLDVAESLADSRRMVGAANYMED